MVDVHDPVARLEVAETGEERARSRLLLVADQVLVVEQVRLRVDLQMGAGQPESARQLPRRDENGRRRGRLRPLDLDAYQIVLGQQLDNPLGPARCFGDEQQAVAPFAPAPHVVQPLMQMVPEAEGGLTGDVTGARLDVERIDGCRAVEPAGDAGAVVALLTRWPLHRTSSDWTGSNSRT